MSAWFHKQTLGRLADQAAARFGEREALMFAGRRWSFRALADEVDRAAQGLLALGIRPGEKVGVWLLNRPEWIFAVLALAKIGAVFVPINSRLRTADVGYILDQSDSVALICAQRSGPIDYLAMVRELAPGSLAPRPDAPLAEALPLLRHILLLGESPQPGAISWDDVLRGGRAVSDETLDARAGAVDPDGLLYIMYTSGTTGFPKGAMHCHNILRNVTDQANRLAVTPRDVMLINLPLFHVFAFFEGPLMCLHTGARMVLMESFDAEQTLDAIQAERATMVHGFDFNFKPMLAAQQARPRDVSSLRTGVLGAGMASSTEVAYQAQEVFMPTVSGFGMTEIGIGAALGFITGTREQRCETSGYPLPGYELRVIDPETGQRQPDGEPGEIQVRGYMVTRGYYKKPEETAKAIDAQGWLSTGDMGILRNDGHLVLMGRYKDILKVGGENVDPLEVESFLLQHPAVREVAVVSCPDEALTEVGVAFIVPRPGQPPPGTADIAAFCKGRIAGYKIPKRVEIVEALPVTGSGKVQKFKLREQARAGR
ncbi:MAG: AMP-binding protein [Candidatus Lambdaproteobacteria bacterium]|nr:AMP-binding protein [Candidatus Lambdaproteobacteria bacterium]